MQSVRFNDDGSGSVYVFAGMPAETVGQLGEEFGGGMEMSEDSVTKTINGVDYIGSELNETFDTLDGFNAIMAPYCVIAKAEEGGYVLWVDFENESPVSQSGENIEMTEETQAQLEEAMKSMYVQLAFDLPWDVTQMEGNTQFTNIEGNKVTITITGSNSSNSEYHAVFTSGDVKTLPAKPVIGEETGDTEDPDTTPEPVPEKPELVIPSSGFKDVNEGAWYTAAVDAAKFYGVMSGYDDGLFHPNDKLTYAQFCQILANLGDYTKGLASKNYWAEPAISVCISHNFIVSRGVITADNYDVPITREAAIAGIYRYLMETNMYFNYDAEPIIPPDIDKVSEMYLDDILAAYMCHLTSGVDAAGTFKPKDSLTRAQLAQLVYNANIFD